MTKLGSRFFNLTFILQIRACVHLFNMMYTSCLRFIVIKLIRQKINCMNVFIFSYYIGTVKIDELSSVS